MFSEAQGHLRQMWATKANRTMHAKTRALYFFHGDNNKTITRKKISVL